MLPFIDEDNKRLVVPALFEIISRDNVIDELHTDSFEKYVGVTKSTLLEEKNIILPELLAGILLNMVIVVKNTDGSSDAKEIDNDFVDQFRKKADEFHRYMHIKMQVPNLSTFFSYWVRQMFLHINKVAFLG